jgi:hypothetical protein
MECGLGTGGVGPGVRAGGARLTRRVPINCRIYLFTSSYVWLLGPREGLRIRERATASHNDSEL